MFVVFMLGLVVGFSVSVSCVIFQICNIRSFRGKFYECFWFIFLKKKTQLFLFLKVGWGRRFLVYNSNPVSIKFIKS